MYDVRDCVLIGVSQLRHIRGDSSTILRALTSPQGGPGADAAAAAAAGSCTVAHPTSDMYLTSAETHFDSTVLKNVSGMFLL